MKWAIAALALASAASFALAGCGPNIRRWASMGRFNNVQVKGRYVCAPPNPAARLFNDLPGIR
jgi:hypothetical protein